MDNKQLKSTSLIGKIKNTIDFLYNFVILNILRRKDIRGESDKNHIDNMKVLQDKNIIIFKNNKTIKIINKSLNIYNCNSCNDNKID